MAQTKAKKHTVLHAIGRAFLTVFLILVITGCIVGTVFAIYILQYVNIDPGVDIRNIKLNYTSIIWATDANGENYELKRLHSEENRIWVDIDQMPVHLQKAAIAAEDKRFEYHHGVDWKRTIYSAINEVLHLSKRQGGSTITQQLIKNITKNDEVRVERKIKEIFSALNLEKEYTKSEILEAYLNTIHLGNNTNGVQAAANLYFGKDVSELTLAESASIIAITQYPVYYNPFSYPENNKERQLYILDEMVKAGFISQEERDAAAAEELHFQKQQYNETITATNSWYVDAVIEEVKDDLCAQYGYNSRSAMQKILSGGLQIYTVYDKNVQESLEKIFENDDEYIPKVYNKEQPQAAMAVLGYDGSILGLVGGRGTKDGSRSYNRATMSFRSPGSTIKPIGLYALAIDQNLVNWSTYFEDAPFLDLNDDGVPEWPVNYYSGQRYGSHMTIQKAIEVSCNTIAAKTCQMVGYNNVFDFLTQKLHFSQIQQNIVINGKVFTDNAIAPMSTGSLTKGVSVVEMAAAYAMFGNGGVYCTPHTYTVVYDASGNRLLTDKSNPQRVLSQDTASLMNKLLQSVVTGTNGSGKPARFTREIELAGKTGTTSNNKDLWYVGFTPEYTAAVWIGFDEQKVIRYGSPYPPPSLWGTAMKEIYSHIDDPKTTFSLSKNLVQLEYCTETGLIASSGCPTTAKGWYLTSRIPETCDHGSSWWGGGGSGNFNWDDPIYWGGSTRDSSISFPID